MPRILVGLALGACLAGAAPAAPTPALVIQGDRVLAGVRAGSTRAVVEARFGPADSARRTSPGECRLVWLGLGLTMTLIDFAATAPCRGAFVIATVTSRAWRTVKGLRVGATSAQLRTLYPAARFHTGFAPERGWWLVPRRRCAETGGGPYPGLLARMHAGRVSALVLTVGVCE